MDPTFLERILDQQKLAELESKLGYAFQDSKLLIEAITHRSYSNQQKSLNLPSNERLEFFGDAVLKLFVSEYLFRLYPDHNEGALTKIRAHLVSDANLGKLGQRLKLGDHLLFSISEKKSGGSRRPSTLADSVEAVIGAIYLDGGPDTTHKFVEHLFETYPDLFRHTTQIKDYKTALQEYLQKQHLPLPEYQIDKEEGPDHDKRFHITLQVTLNGEDFEAVGDGASKKKAEQDCARKLLELLPLNVSFD